MGADERLVQLRAEIARLVTDATDETRTDAFRGWSARRIPHAQARLFAYLDRQRETQKLSGPDATLQQRPGSRTVTESAGMCGQERRDTDI